MRPKHLPPLPTGLDLKSLDATGTFEGYAALFHREDLGHDVILPGAFAESLRRRATGDIKLLFQHDPAEPIGIWERIEEDARGLKVRGRLLPGVARAREVLALMRAGALDGLSIGFRALAGRRDPKTRVRRLTRIDLWEISIVTFPMQPEARIDALKAARPATFAEFEQWLTRDNGFTRAEAHALLAGGLDGLLKQQRDAGSDAAALRTTIRAATAMMRR